MAHETMDREGFEVDGIVTHIGILEKRRHLGLKRLHGEDPDICLQGVHKVHWGLDWKFVTKHGMDITLFNEVPRDVEERRWFGRHRHVPLQLLGGVHGPGTRFEMVDETWVLGRVHVDETRVFLNGDLTRMLKWSPKISGVMQRCSVGHGKCIAV